MRSPPRRSTRATLTGLLAAALIDLSGCSATWVLDNRWIEVRSEHFTITSDMKTEDAEELARSLELFRAAVLVMLDTPSTESSVPTRVFFFARSSSFRDFRPGRYAVGYLIPTLRANFVAIVKDRKLDAKQVLRHEYVHFLVRNGTRRIHPKWYDEGFAELLSTAGPVGRHIAIGIVPEFRVRHLKRWPWIPMRDVLSYDGTQRWTSGRVATFYAQSWALLHYLTRDLAHAAALGRSVETYLDQVESGADVDAACRAAFGMGVEELDEQVRLHLREGSFTPLGVPMDRIRWPEETSTRRLTRAETAERLGALSLALNNVQNAEDFFRAAIAADPRLARAHAGLGVALVQRERWDEAEQHFATALDLGPDDPLNVLDQGAYWLSRAGREQDPERRRESLERARPLLLRALDMDEWKPEPWTLHGASFLEPGEDASRSVEWIERGLQLLPSSPTIQLLLAEAYVETGREPEARALLRRILSWDRSGKVADKARALGSRLDPEPGLEPQPEPEARAAP